jgi:hypothetical protein
MFAYGSTWDEWVKQEDLSGGSPYALEVPVNKIHAVKVFYSFRTVDKLRGLSVPAHHHEELSRTNCIRSESLCLIYSIMFPFGIHSETMVSLASGVSSQRQTPMSSKTFGCFNDFHNITSLQNLR